MLENALRLAFRFPWHSALMRQVLLRRSEISLEEGRFLGSLIQRADPARPIIEIGTLFGGSTRMIAMFKQPETPLITVDSFRWNPFGLSRSQHSAITRSILADAEACWNVSIVEMDKRRFYETYAGEAPGLVFLDANHSYESTLADINWARRTGAQIVCGHDYSPRFDGVVRAVAESGGARSVVGTLFELAM